MNMGWEVTVGQGQSSQPVNYVLGVAADSAAFLLR